MAEEMKRVWDNYELIGEVQKSEGTKFMFFAATRDGYRYISIREFYLAKRTGVWHPSRDGILIPLMMPIKGTETILKPHEGFVEMLAKTAEYASIMELMDESKMVFVERKQK